jgi:DNA polymerase I
MFKPDPDHIIFDADLSGADAQVVAWEANDEDLMDAFQKGLKVHVKNFEDMFDMPFKPEHKVTPFEGRRFAPYDEMKRAVHATNYGAVARTVAITLGWRIAEAEKFQRKWFKLHPAINKWHERIEHELQTRRKVENKFGYSITYFDRPEGLLPQALAWVPQATVAVLCARAVVTLREDFPKVKGLLQVHDSVVFQIHKEDVTAQLLKEIHDAITIPVPYSTPLTIPWEIAASDKSWGDCKSIGWDGKNLEILRQLA